MSQSFLSDAKKGKDSIELSKKAREKESYIKGEMRVWAPA
jgi:hypothetical protein